MLKGEPDIFGRKAADQIFSENIFVRFLLCVGNLILPVRGKSSAEKRLHTCAESTLFTAALSPIPVALGDSESPRAVARLCSSCFFVAFFR